MKNIFTFKMIKVAGIVMSVVLGLGAMAPAMAATDFVAGDVKTTFIGGSVEFVGTIPETFNETSEGNWVGADSGTVYTQAEMDLKILSSEWTGYDAGTEFALWTQSEVDAAQNADTTFSNALTAAVLGNLTFNTTTGLYEADGDIQNLVDAINAAILANKSGIATLVAIDNFTQAEFATFNSTNSTAIADALTAAKEYADLNDTVLTAAQVNAAITKVTLTTLLSGEYDPAGSAAAAQSAAEQYADLNDANTQLSDSAVVTIITDSAIFQATLTQAQLDSFTAMTTDTNLSDSAVVAIISANGGFQTTLTQAQLDSFTAMTTDTNTQLTDAQVRALISVSGSLSYANGVISFTERSDSAIQTLARNALSVSGDLDYDASTGIISFTGRTDGEVTVLANTAGDARIAAALLSGSILSSSDIALAISTAITNAAAGTSTAADGVQNTNITANADAITALQNVDNLTQAEFDAINFDVVSTEDGRLNDLIVANAGDISGLDTRLDTAEGAITVLNGDASVEGSVAKDIADAISTAAGTQSTTDGTQTQAIDAIGSFDSVEAVVGVMAVAEVLAVAEVVGVTAVAAVAYVAPVTGVTEVLGNITGTYNGNAFLITEISEGVWEEVDSTGTAHDVPVTRVQAILDGTAGDNYLIVLDPISTLGITGVTAVTEVLAVAEVVGVTAVAEVLYVAPVTGVDSEDATFTGDGEFGEVAIALTNEQAARIMADAELQADIDANKAAQVIKNAALDAADAALGVRIDTNATAIADLATRVTTEVANLNTAITTGDAASVTTAANALSAAQTALYNRIAQEATFAANQLTIERNRAVAAELVLTNALAQEETDRNAADAIHTTAIARNAADLVTEAGVRAAADSQIAADLVAEAVLRADADMAHDMKLAAHEGRLNDIDVILADHEARISFLESLHVVDKSFSKVIDGPNGTKIVMHFDADGTQRGKARTLTFLENPVVHGEFDILWNDAGEAVNAITGKLVDPMTGLEFDEMAGFSAAAVEDVNVFFGDMFITPKTNTTPFDTAFVAEEVAPVAPFSLDAGTFVLPSSASKVGSK